MLTLYQSFPDTSSVPRRSLASAIWVENGFDVLVAGRVEILRARSSHPTGGLRLDNVTHGLCGLGIYGVWTIAAPEEAHTRIAGAVLSAAILGSEAPDFDYVIKLVRGPVAYLRQHRALSHGVLFWLLWSTSISAFLSLWRPGRFGLLFLVALAGVLIHVGLDVLTTYGTQALSPLSNRRFAFDTLFIVDGVFFVCGFGGWFLAGTLVPVRTVLAVVGVIITVYLVLRISFAQFLKRRLRAQFDADWWVNVVPGPLPWWWSYVAQRDGTLLAGRMRPSGTLRPEVVWREPEDADGAFKYAIAQSDVGQAFRWFARHLIWTKSVDGVWVRITLAEATYRYRRLFPFTAYVHLQNTANGWQIVKEALRGQDTDVSELVQDAVGHREVGEARMPESS